MFAGIQQIKLKTKQIDFNNVFVQAELKGKDSIYLMMPPSGVEYIRYNNKSIVWKLLKSLYGMADAPRFWFEKKKEGLKSLGFEASAHNKCLSIHRKRIILLLPVNTCLVCGQNADIRQ